MADAAKIYFDKGRGHWYVWIEWKARRYYFSQYMGMRCGTNPDKACPVAQRLKNLIDSEIEQGIFNPARYKKSRPLHLDQYYRQWLSTLPVEGATLHDYQNSFKNHILPILGNEYLPDINFDKLKELQNKIARQPKGKKNVMGALKKLMRDAHKSGHIQQMPPFPEFTGKDKITKPKIRWIDQEIQWRIINEIPLSDRPIFIFMQITGCRPSEARAFRKSDIKPTHIVFAKTFGMGEVLKDVKGKNEEPFPITDGLRQLFADMPGNLSPFVFINSKTGKPYTKNINRDFWNPACVSAGFNPKDVPLYSSTRHSAACRWLNAGIDKAMVQRLLRHTDPKMVERYAEYLTESLKTALDNVEKFDPSRKKRSF